MEMTAAGARARNSRREMADAEAEAGMPRDDDNGALIIVVRISVYRR